MDIQERRELSIIQASRFAAIRWLKRSGVEVKSEKPVEVLRLALMILHERGDHLRIAPTDNSKMAALILSDIAYTGVFGKVKDKFNRKVHRAEERLNRAS